MIAFKQASSLDASKKLSPPPCHAQLSLLSSLLILFRQIATCPNRRKSFSFHNIFREDSGRSPRRRVVPVDRGDWDRRSGKEMLVLSRKVGERILIGENISVTVVRIAGGAVRIGVEAPPELPVIREELKGHLEETDAQRDRPLRSS
jgi:carbon storage regulator